MRLVQTWLLIWSSTMALSLGDENKQPDSLVLFGGDR